jgi:hypothetical protein
MAFAIDSLLSPASPATPEVMGVLIDDTQGRSTGDEQSEEEVYAAEEEADRTEEEAEAEEGASRPLPTAGQLPHKVEAPTESKLLGPPVKPPRGRRSRGNDTIGAAVPAAVTNKPAAAATPLPFAATNPFSADAAATVQVSSARVFKRQRLSGHALGAPTGTPNAFPAMTPGRQRWIRMPMRPLPEEIVLQKRLVLKSDELIRMTSGPKVDGRLAMEARKSLMVEKFRLEALTSTAGVDHFMPAPGARPTWSAEPFTAAEAVPAEAQRRNVAFTSLSIPIDSVKTSQIASSKTPERGNIDFFMMISCGAQVCSTEIVSTEPATRLGGGQMELDFLTGQIDDMFVFESIPHTAVMEFQLYASRSDESRSTKKSKNKIPKMLKRTKKHKKKFDGHGGGGGGGDGGDGSSDLSFDKIASATIHMGSMSMQRGGRHMLIDCSPKSDDYPIQLNMNVGAIVSEPEAQPHCEGTIAIFNNDPTTSVRERWIQHWAVLHRDKIRFWESSRAWKRGAACSAPEVLFADGCADAARLRSGPSAKKHCVTFNTDGDTEVTISCPNLQERTDWIRSINECTRESRAWKGWAGSDEI